MYCKENYVKRTRSWKEKVGYGNLRKIGKRKKWVR